MPQVKADPFDVQLANDQDFSTDVLQPLAKLPLIHMDGQPSRWMDLGDGWLVVDHLDRIGGKYPRWEGAIQRVFNNEHPNHSGPHRTTAPLKLDPADGLGEHVAFLYDEESKLLWLQRDRRVCGKLYFGDYLRALVPVSFSLVIRLRTDALKRARKLNAVRGLSFAYLTRDSNKPKGSIEKLLARFSGFGAARIEIKLTPVRGGTLDPSVKQVVADVASEIEDESDVIGKATVLGRMNEDDERDMFIDLLRDRAPMSFNIPANRTRDARRLIAAVREIWSDNRDKV